MKRSIQTAFAWSVVALLMATAPADAQKRNPRNSDQFDETLDVVTIEVPVQVIQDGDPVRGLTAGDFRLFDGRKEQEITGFDVVDLREPGKEAPRRLEQVPISARRHFLLLFDLSFSDPSVIARARHAALDLVEEEFHPSDVVAVATYTHNHGPQLALGFTSDRRQIRLAVETLGLPQLFEQANDPLALILGDPDLAGPDDGVGVEGETGVADAEAEFLAQARDYAIGFNRQRRGEAQGQVLALTTAMEDLAKVMRDVTGRKYVVYLSEGFDSDVILGTDDAERSREMAAAVANNESWRVDSEERYGSTGTLTAVNSMLEEFRRADCTIQAVDVGGLRAGDDARARAGGQDSLFMMADQTGGELYRNFNDLGGAMGEMLERTSVTYVLAFQPEDLESDGDYHRLRIEVDGTSRGTRVLHRPGYYAPRPFADRSPLEKRLEAAEKILSGREAGPLSIAAVAAPFRAEAGQAYVPVLIEIDGPGLLAGLDGDTAALEVYAYAIAEDGTVQDFLSQNMGLEVAKVRPALEASGLKFFGDLDLPSGEYLLRVLVRDSASGRSSTRVVPLTVPEFGSGAPTLAMPLFPEEPGKWLTVQEAAGAEARTDRPYPFILEGNAYMPAARPVVAAGGSAEFVLLGYNLGDGSVPLETRFTTLDGEPVEGLAVSFVGRERGASPGATHLRLKLEAGDAPAGEYRLVAGIQGEAATASIPVVVQDG
ncbi:MAG: VWA domain-containing protein [Thermoanaerobaculia bacterium]